MQQEAALEIIRRAGRAVHGARWQVPLSRDLGMTDRALRYWLDGTNAVPTDEVLPKLLVILRSHKITLEGVLSDIEVGIRQ